MHVDLFTDPSSTSPCPDLPILASFSIFWTIFPFTLSFFSLGSLSGVAAVG